MQLPSAKWFIPAVIIFTLFFYGVVMSFADENCGCTRETKDPVCQGYYELKDAGFDVEVICGEELKERQNDKKVQESV